MLNVMTVDEVLDIIGNNFRDYTLETEIINLDDAFGRITGEEIRSIEDIPGFNRSLVDGFAVAGNDTNGASDALPVELKIAGEVQMGIKPEFTIEKGETAYVPTGGEIPDGADSVIMIEYTEKLEDGSILIQKPAAPGNHIIFRGDDTKSGNIVIPENHLLRTQDIAALAAMGFTEINVKRKLRAGIISTGDELVEIYEKTSGAQVRDVNSHLLYSELKRCGVIPVFYGIVKDGYERVKSTTEIAAKECDLVLISGGSSVGRQDETFNVISSLPGCRVLARGIAVKPGKPTILANFNGKAMVGLPGHPVSAYFICKIIVSRLIDIMYGKPNIIKPYIPAEMESNYPSNEGREEYLPVTLDIKDGKTLANPIFGKSGLIMLLANAAGYIKISRSMEGISTGQSVKVFLF